MHHVHGGSVRWRRQPGAEPADLVDRPRQASAARPRRVGAHRRAEHRPVRDVRHRRRVRQRRLPAERRRLPGPLPRRRALLRRHVDDLARLQHAAGRRRLDRCAAAAAGAARTATAVPRAAVTSDGLAGTTVDWSGQAVQHRHRRGPRGVGRAPAAAAGRRRAATTPRCWTGRGDGDALPERAGGDGAPGRATRRARRASGRRSSSIRRPASSRTRSCGRTSASGRRSRRTTARRRTSTRRRPALRPAAARRERSREPVPGRHDAASVRRSTRSRCRSR